MINTRGMYLRPGNLFKDFIVENNHQKVTETGRVIHKLDDNNPIIIRGCLAEANDEIRKAHNRSEHIVTHTIVQAGKPKAKRTDRLICGNRAFYIVDIDDVGALEMSTIYYAEERKDVK